MKWACLIYDPENYIAKQVQLENYGPFTDIICCNTYHGMVRWAEDNWNKFDHVFMVYDGHWFLDGLANQSFYCVKYGTRTLCHVTTKLIEEMIFDIEYNAANGAKLFDRIKEIFNKRFNS